MCSVSNDELGDGNDNDDDEEDDDADNDLINLARGDCTSPGNELMDELFNLLLPRVLEKLARPSSALLPGRYDWPRLSLRLASVNTTSSLPFSLPPLPVL